MAFSGPSHEPDHLRRVHAVRGPGPDLRGRQPYHHRPDDPDDNARHFFYGLSMLDKYQDTGRAKPYLIFSLTDETYSLVCSPAPEGVDEKRYYLSVSLLNQCYWIAGSVLGGLLGPILPFDSTGMDFAMTALFVVIFVEQWRSAKTHIPALLGVGISVLCLVLLGPTRFVIPAMVGITLALALLRGRLEVRHG